MYIYTLFCRNQITLYRYEMVFIVPHRDIELEDNKQFISNTLCTSLPVFDSSDKKENPISIWDIFITFQ